MGIKYMVRWIYTHPKAKEWFWFFTLWLSGLATALAIAYPIKWLIRHI
jgi:hypothetical protein